MHVEPEGQPIVMAGAAIDLAGAGVIRRFADWPEPAIAAGTLMPMLADWEAVFSGPCLYYPDRRLVPAPPRAFIDVTRP